MQYSCPAILSCPIPAGVLPSLPHQSTIRRVRAEHLSAQPCLRHNDIEDTTTRVSSCLGLSHHHFWASETIISGPQSPSFLGLRNHHFWASETIISGPQKPSFLGLRISISGPQKPSFLGLRNHNFRASESAFLGLNHEHL